MGPGGIELGAGDHDVPVPIGDTCCGCGAQQGDAVGAATGRNPISIVIPCHRLVGASGSLTGYAGGVECKRFLLRLEGAEAIGPGTPRG